MEARGQDPLATTGATPGGDAREAARTAAEQGGQVVGAAGEQVREVAGTAAGQAGEIVETATEQAREMASTVMDQVGQVTGEAAAQARNLLDESRTQLHSQAESQTERIAGTLRQLGDQMKALAEGRASEAGPLGDYARQAAGMVDRYAGEIERRGFDGLVQDVQRFARRRPGAFLLGAAVAGLGVGRLARAVREQPSSDPARAQMTGAVSTGMSGVTGLEYTGAGMAPAVPEPVDLTAADLATAGVSGGASITGMSTSSDSTATIDMAGEDAYAAPGRVPPPVGGS